MAVVTLLLPVPCARAAGAQCEAGNLLPNCGFEVDTSGWAPTFVDSLTRTTEEAHGGVASGEADAALAANFEVTVATCADVVAGEIYQVAGYFKLASGALPTCYVGALFIGAAGCAGFPLDNLGTEVTVVDTLEWLRPTAVVTAPPGAQSVAILPTCWAAGDFVVRLDDFSVEELEPGFADGFESGDASAWDIVVSG